MYKFVLFAALVAVASAAPGYVAAPLAAVPVATSYANTYKVSVKSPLVHAAPLTYAAPATYVKAAPVAYTAPLAYAAAPAYVHGAPLAYGYGAAYIH